MDYREVAQFLAVIVIFFGVALYLLPGPCGHRCEQCEDAKRQKAREARERSLEFSHGLGYHNRNIVRDCPLCLAG